MITFNTVSQTSCIIKSNLTAITNHWCIKCLICKRNVCLSNYYLLIKVRMYEDGKSTEWWYFLYINFQIIIQCISVSWWMNLKNYNIYLQQLTKINGQSSIIFHIWPIYITSSETNHATKYNILCTHSRQGKEWYGKNTETWSHNLAHPCPRHSVSIAYSGHRYLKNQLITILYHIMAMSTYLPTVAYIWLSFHMCIITRKHGNHPIAK